MSPIPYRRREIFKFLCDYHKKNNHYPQNKDIVKHLNITPEYISVSLRRLEELNYIQRKGFLIINHNTKICL